LQRKAAKKIARAGKEKGHGELGSDVVDEEEFDVSDSEWAAEDRYMKSREALWDFEEQHPELCTVEERPWDPAWLNKPITPLTRGPHSPEHSKFIMDVNRRRLLPSMHQK
jgi:hypothetical protein